MKKNILKLLRGLAEPLLLVLFIPSAFLFKLYRLIGSSRLPLTTKILKNIGVMVIRDHYYEPMFNYPENKRRSQYQLLRFGFNLARQQKLLAELNFTEELLALRFDSTQISEDKFYLPNGSFESGDAEFLYSFIRYYKPRKVVEIGGGHSTKVISLALTENQMERADHSAKHMCIEPFPKRWLKKIPNLDLREIKIEDSDICWRNELRAGDLLFIDSSHMIRPDGDVLMEYLEILPELSPGVLIHIHDIFTPSDYLKKWRENDVLFWNEQYLLEAILVNSNRYSVLAGLNYLMHNSYDELKEICPYLDENREPGSIYLVVNKEEQ